MSPELQAIVSWVWDHSPGVASFCILLLAWVRYRGYKEVVLTLVDQQAQTTTLRVLVKPTVSVQWGTTVSTPGKVASSPTSTTDLTSTELLQASNMNVTMHMVAQLPTFSTKPALRLSGLRPPGTISARLRSTHTPISRSPLEDAPTP